MSRRLVAILFMIAAVYSNAKTLDSIAVDEATIQQHIMRRVAPVFPPIAKAARIVGTVVFDVQIDRAGKVTSTKIVSGPAMLRQAAVDAVKQWTFRPFEKDGNPADAAGRIAITFTLGKNDPTPDEDRIAQAYFPLSDKCRKEVSAHSDPKEAASTCGEAANLAEQFANDRRFIEKRSAYVWATYAFLAANHPQTALQWGEKAVSTVQLGHDDNSGSNAAYSVRAYAEARSGNLDAADRDLDTAEEFQRKGIVWAEKEAPELARSYKQSLVQDLRIHAQVLNALGKAEKAKEALDEAARYDSLH